MRKDIEEVIHKYKSNTILFKSSIKMLEKYLDGTEEVLYINGCNCNMNPTNKMKVTTMSLVSIKNKEPFLFTITNKRIILCKKIIINEIIKIIDYDKLQSWNMIKNMFGGSLRIQTLTEIYDVDLNCKKETYESIKIILSNWPVFKDNKAISSQLYEELKQIKELLDMGIITQEEFDAKKKQLLRL